jgi:Tfp pilus assembly protein PilF
VSPLNRIIICALALSSYVGATSFAQTRADLSSGARQNHETATTTDERADALVAQGAAQLAEGRTDAAKDFFHQALAINPRAEAAHTYLGVIADRENNLTEAERQFAAAVAAAPRSPAAHNNYGAILLRLGLAQQAAAQFELSLKLDQNQRNALINLAQIRFAHGTIDDLRAAHDLFTRANALGQDVRLARALVVVALRLDNQTEVRAAYRDYTALLATDPAANNVATPQLRAELGTALLEGKLFAEAATELNEVVAAEPTNVAAIVRLARAYLAQQDIKAAGRTLEAAVARGVDAAPIYAELANVYESGGYFEHAIPAMRIALARDPHNEIYHYRYGLLLTHTNAPAAAIIRLQESLTEFPNSPRIWLALGIAQLTDGKNAEAEQSFTRALALDPKSVPALAYLGTTNAERGNYAQAIACYERAIAADDHLAVPYYLAADTMLRQPDLDSAKAEKYLLRAIELDPSLATARLALAKLYVRAERWSDAAAQLERAVQLAPDLSEAHYQLGRVYVRLKRTAEAQRELALFKQQSDAEKQRRVDERRELVRRLANVNF